MSLNHHLPTRECASAAALLPLAAHDMLSEQEAARLQTHLTTCAHCRAELALDAQIEAALRRSYALPEASSPLLSREEIAALLSAGGAQTAPNANAAAQQARSAPPAIPAASERSARRWLGGLPALAATMVIILLAVAIFGIPGLFPGLHRSAAQPQPTVTPQVNMSHYILHGISMVSPTEGWAVGNTWMMVDSGSRTVRMDGGNPVILHYQGGRWTPQPLPDFKSHFGCSATPTICPALALSSISMVSAQEGWAVGSTVLGPNADGITFPILLHYIGGAWTWVNEQQREAVSKVYMRSATDGWMLKGFINDGSQWVAQHYDGHIWTPVSDPIFAGIAPNTLTETADGQVWISGVDYSAPVGDGEDGNEPAVLLHYDGQHWTKIDPHVANARLIGLSFVSPTEGWAVGAQPNNKRGTAYEADGIILHYSNGVWQQQKLFKNPFGHQTFSFSDVAMASPNEGWAVGDEGVILHYHNGAWGEFQHPTGQTLSSVVMVSPGEGWAVGDGVIVHYQAGSWRVYGG